MPTYARLPRKKSYIHKIGETSKAPQKTMSMIYLLGVNYVIECFK